MNDELSRMDVKLDRIIDVLGEHSLSLVKQGMLHEQNAAQLVVHIARTNLLEQHMESEHKEMKENMETALIPIKFFKSVKWLAAFIVSIGAAIITLKSLGVIK